MTASPPSAWARFRASPPAVFGLGLTALVVGFALLVPIVWPHAPDASDFDLPRSPVGGPPLPSLSHPLGADLLHRDVLARLAEGGRLSLGIAAVATVLALAFGTFVGVIAGATAAGRYWLLDAVLMRVVDVALAFPYLLLVTTIGVALDEASPATIAAILGSTGWVGLARLVRARTRAVLELDHVTAARALGVAPHQVVWRHVLPHLRDTLLVLGSQALGQFVLAEAVLGYLTVGVGPPRASWGRMLQEVEHYLGAQPLLVAAPAFAIVLTVLGFTRVADGLADALDPKARPARAGWPADALILGALVAALVGFAGSEPLRPPLTRPTNLDAVLRLATSTMPGPLDPALANDEGTLGIDALVHGRLLGRDADGHLVGELAEGYAVEDGGRVVRLTMREDAFFHDGSQVRASDVKRSLERALHPETPCPGAGEFAALRGFEAFREGRAREIAGIELVDARTVRFVLDLPDVAFPALLGLGFAAPVCPGAAPRADAGSPATCGAGAFRLVRRDDDAIELERVASPRAGEPPGALVRTVRWSLGVPFRTQLYRFLEGDLDLLTEVSGVDGQRFDAEPRWRPFVRWSSRPVVEGIFLDTSRPPFSNRHLRRAVAFAVDPRVLERLRPSLSAVDRLLPAGLPRPERGAPRRHDLAAALEEMRLAGHPFDPATGRGGYPETIDYVTVASSLDQSVAEVMQAQLARVGLRVRVKPRSYASYSAEVGTRGAAVMGWRGWHPDYPDPSAMIDPTLTRAAIADRGSQNVSFFESDALDRLAAAARREPDLGPRMRLYEAIEELLREEAPWIPTYATRAFVAHQPYVRGLSFTPDGRLELTRAHLANGAPP